MTESAGRFTEQAMRAAMHQIAARLGVAAGDAQLLRMTNNAVYALPSAGLVIRITRSHALHDRALKVARLATWFAAVDAPTIRLVPDIEQPVRANGLSATVWRLVAPTPRPPTVEELGQVLREFHSLGLPPFPLPEWDPVGDVRTRLIDAEALNPDDRDFLLEWCDRLAPRIADLNAQARGLVHADAHVGNLLREADGRVVLCDFDPTCIGPWQVDLAAVPVGEIHFGRAGAHQALTSAYGYDVTTDPAWPTLREARELKMIAAAVPLLASTPGVADEFAVRLASVRNKDDTVRWTPFVDLTSRTD
ncbi:phosphotransferase family protein [Solwaraspora sp. WMMA2101]|uniref:phosphotransferase family protein n=1 Tax=Solwaraspora sp. WMMA2101 TaxID=3404124 RepID=UPI003B9377EE